MIKARIDRSKGIISVEGHAGAERNAQGHDLVCCAASVLLQAFLISAVNAGYRASYDLEPGNSRVELEEADRDEGIRARLKMLEDGLCMLEKAYPKCIRVER